MEHLVAQARELFAKLGELPTADRIDAINQIRQALSEHSPFAAEPVDCVLWVRGTEVVANAYNPNSVAAPEMDLLRLSVESDGYTQPVVVNKEATGFEVVDGFHRSCVGKEKGPIKDKLGGYLPIVQIRSDRVGVHDRMASTIRHNRARGKHGVEQMSSIVAELVKRGWDEAKISKELGMDPDEVLRLRQITGIAEMFRDREFSMAWAPSDIPVPSDA